MNQKEEKEIFEKRDEKKYKKLKLKLETLQKREKNGALIWGILVFILFTGIFFSIFRDSFYEEKSLSIFLAIVCGLTSGLITFLYTNSIFEMQENRIRREMIEYEAEDIKKDIKEDIFENSIKMSYKYLDQYYLQTREQAQKGFLVTVCVAIFGAILIAVGIGSMFLGKIQPSYVTCASGVITEFIAAIFFYLYNRTITSMSNYHNKLVISQNISIALKVADSLPNEDKVNAKNIIIKELLKDVNSYLVQKDSTDVKKE